MMYSANCLAAFIPEIIYLAQQMLKSKFIWDSFLVFSFYVAYLQRDNQRIYSTVSSGINFIKTLGLQKQLKQWKFQLMWPQVSQK